jgi:tRNA(Ile2) C34 agmatinyltransferase TiaS
MIYVGIDDTDTLDDPGTNQLARHIVRELAGRFRGHMILRHQLLEDPRVPCTKKNGCASILVDPLVSNAIDCSPPLGGEGSGEGGIATLITSLRDLILPWCPKASDPGLCVTTSVPPSIIEWGLRCQREFVTQDEARQLARENGIYLEGLGGTEDGVIGALAAVGLMATQNDGRVVYFGPGYEDWYDVTGILSTDEIHTRGVEEIRIVDSGELLTSAAVDIGKRLRPNFRDGKIVLYVTRGESADWQAVRVT